MTIKMTFSTIKPLLYHKKRVKPHRYIPLLMTFTLYFNAYTYTFADSEIISVPTCMSLIDF